MNRRHILYSMFYDMQKQQHGAFVSPDGRLAAVVSPGKPLWLYPGENGGEEAIRLFFNSCIQKWTAAPVGIVAPPNAAEICARACVSVYGGGYAAKEIIAYYYETPPEGAAARSGGAGGKLRKAVPADSGWITGWLKAFYGESLHLVFPADGRVSSAPADSGKLYIWQDGRPVAMGMIGGGSDTTARLNLIYTPPGYRRRGYGTAVVRALAEMAVHNGKVPVLYAAADNTAANALYFSLGFTEAGRLTEILFNGRQSNEI